MIKIIKKIIPNQFLRLFRNSPNSKFHNKNTNEVFTEIYNSNHWQSSESISGTGSELKQTESLINNLDKLFADLNITSVLDLPCGDFKWMQKVDLSKIDYLGADIVEDLIKHNTINYSSKSEKIKFKVVNLLSDTLPPSQIIIVRDCLVHLSFEDINRAIKNIKSSGCKYLLTTTFTNHHLNKDIETGDWRPLNLQNKPFNFSTPILVINENCTEGNGKYKDKSMALWEIQKF